MIGLEIEQKDGVYASQRKRTRLSFATLQFTFWAAFACLSFNVQLLKSCGFGSREVGLLLALGFLAGMVAPPIWGYIADKIRSVKKTYLIVLCLTTVALLLFPISKYILIGGVFPTIAVMYPTFTLLRAPANSLLDSWTVSKCNEYGITYSHVRLFGSLGFSIVSSAFTWVATRFGVEAPYYVSVVMLCFLLLYASRQPDESRALDETDKAAEQGESNKLSPTVLFKNYYFVVFLLFNIALAFATSSTMSFMPYFLEHIGQSEALTGLVGGLRAACEIPILLLGHVFIKRFKLSTMLGMVGSIYVGCLFSFQVINTLPGIIICQCVQGFAYGLFLSSAIQYAYMLAPSELRATAQSLVTTTMFMGFIITSLLGGWLIGAIGIRGMFLVIMIVMAGCLMIYIGSFPFGRRVLKIEQIDHRKAA